MTDKPMTQRGDYHWFAPITTRWMDNDIYGHINNVVYYSYFDSVANQFLIDEGGLDIHAADVVGFVVSSACDYHRPLAYPQALQGGLRLNRLGNSSLEYGLAIFSDDMDEAAASGRFTHVFVDRASGKPVSVPDSIRSALGRLAPA